MVKVTKSVVIEIEKDGQRMTLFQSEFDDIKRQLESAVREKGREVKAISQKPAAKAPSGKKQKQPVHMSEEKRKGIMSNVDKKLSETPKTLSALLDGVSYVPNYLPAIRKMVEGRRDVAKKIVGKRTLYFRKK
jgi:hypothetical protein